MWNQSPSLKAIADDAKRSLSLKRIVADDDTKSLEAFCHGRTYQQVRNYARDVGVDLDALEELLGRI